jgi:hypothetical protein
VTGVSWESRPGQVSVRRAKHPGDACRGTAGRKLRWVRIVCWQLGDPSDGGCEDLASSSLLSGSLPCGSTEGGRASPFSGEPPTGEPCAGEPLARFGGRGDRATGLPYPYPRIGGSVALAPDASHARRRPMGCGRGLRILVVAISGSSSVHFRCRFAGVGDRINHLGRLQAT